jgi:FMN reductase
VTTTVVLSGNPRPGSRTRRLAEAVAEVLGADDAVVVDLSELGAKLLTPGDEATAAAVETVRAAERLIVATPTYKGAYTGILKVLFDLFPAGGLDGVTAVPVVTAGNRQQAEAAAGHLRALLSELGATQPGPGLLVTEPELADVRAAAKGLQLTE